MRLYLPVGMICALLMLIPMTIPSTALQAQGPSAAAGETAAPGILGAAEAAKVLPATVFFRGLSAPIQARNSGGVRFSDQRLMLATLVDTSGYSTSVQEKYQAYLITELAIEIGGHTLAPGAYGCGFIANDTFIVQDLGAHDLFTAHSTRDATLRRPTPLQVLAGQEGVYRLYAGRSYIEFRLAKSANP